MNCNIAHNAFATFLILILLSVGTNLYSQIPEEDGFEKVIAKLFETKPKDLGSLDEVLDQFANDSLKMKELMTISKSSNYPEAEAYALNSLGTIYRNISLYQRAITFHKDAEAIALNLKNDEILANSLNLTGVVYRRMDDIKPALDYHAKALDIATNSTPRTEKLKYNIAVSQNSMGNIYLVLNQFNLAIDHFEKSLVLEKEMGNRLGLAINYQNIGYAYEQLGKLDEALANYRRSLDYNEQIDSKIGKVICYNSIGQVFIKQDRLNDAKTIIENALEKALETEDKFYIALSYTNIGWVQKEMGLLQRAENNLMTALKISKEYGLKTSEVSVNELLSDLYFKEGEYNKALTYYKSAVELEKTISNDRNLKYVNDVIVQFENEAKNRQIETLALENEAVRERLKNNQKMFWIALMGLIILAIVLYSISKNRRLTQEKRILTLEQDMLRNQMNPHFIFNSLNSIKLYIINNEKENAVYYLNKFSKLIRKILLSSSEKIISLQDELDTMKLYMNIENIRFSNEIDFNISVDEEVNTSNIKVPPLILQPFLENSLWHGLSTIEVNKIIKLNIFKTSDDFVTITIEDNGIGRSKAEALKKDRILKRKSLGLNITKARLSNFSTSFTHDYHLEIVDLMDKEDNPCGTKVVLKIPIRANVLRTA